MRERYDVIIVGGGSAGCAAAMRLSEDPHRRVLLLEAGPDPQPLPEIVADAAQQTRLLLESPYIEMYPTPRTLDGSIFYSLAGRIMGGGSSVNVMAAPRPLRHDLDTWAALGNPDWAYEHTLPVLKRMETDRDFPDSPLHGRDGPLHIERPLRLDGPLSEAGRAFVERAVSMGLPLCPDLNVPDPLGVCASPYTMKDGRRQSTTVAYLDRARGRPNLTIRAEAPALGLRVVGRRVEEVYYEQGGVRQSVAGDQVVLSAGVYRTPQLLLLSGIGPPGELERLGIPVAHPLAGVGENYQDHATVYLTFEGPTRFAEELIVPRLRLMIKSDPSRPCGDVHIIPRPPTEVAGLRRMVPVSVHLLEQRNRGRVYLASADPQAQPCVDARLLEDPGDVEALVAAMRFVYELASHPTMQRYYGALLQPTLHEDWALWARATHDSYHHGVGTCRMGPASDPLAVVDQHLRVHGLDNLWVADASVAPVVPHANTNLTAILIGELVSDFLRAAA